MLDQTKQELKAALEHEEVQIVEVQKEDTELVKTIQNFLQVMDSTLPLPQSLSDLVNTLFGVIMSREKALSASHIDIVDIARPALNISEVDLGEFLAQKTPQTSPLRLLFMPHGKGIYLAFMLKNWDSINHALQNPQALICSKEGAVSEKSAITSQSNPQVKKQTILNRLFLDTEQLSQNMQVLLQNYEMNVIAQVETIQEHVAAEGEFGCRVLGLNAGDVYARVKVNKVDHIVNFTTRILRSEEKDYSYTDYIFV